MSNDVDVEGRREMSSDVDVDVDSAADVIVDIDIDEITPDEVTPTCLHCRRRRRRYPGPREGLRMQFNIWVCPKSLCPGRRRL